VAAAMGSNEDAVSVARYVNLSFVAIGLVLYVVLGELLSATIEIFGSSANFAILGSNFRLGHLLAMAAAIGIAIVLRKNERIHEFAMEVGQELSKVTWPTWKDTKRATVVVIITTLIIASILGLLDLVWGSVSRLFYS
jgi:preprotein translocase subunit SecE